MAYVQPVSAHPADHDDHHDDHAHPTDAQFVKLAILLTLITIAEVAIYYVDALRPILVPTLVVMSSAKFVFVVWYYMHLKYDDLRLTWIFVAGMATAVVIYIALWVVMHFHMITSYVSNVFF